MSIIKIITGINWILIAIFGYYVVWALLQVSKPSHEMPGVETIIKVTGFVFLLSLIGLNLASYSWMKVVAFILGVILLLIIYSFSDH
ncbi:MAG: hypothetical protein ABIN80_23315 [Dyadobacter sp.]|uniref:hypothetical protein n=1 Tax=Dyadobacter sp. TaxID=1914288 RepID=UPI003264A264